MWCIEKLYVFLVTYCKRFDPKSPLYEKVKMTTKRTIILEFFVIIGSFDCDCIQNQGFGMQWKIFIPKSKVLSIYEHVHGLGANEVNMLEVNYQYNIPGLEG
jgi:hypothetical protein